MNIEVLTNYIPEVTSFIAVLVIVFSLLYRIVTQGRSEKKAREVAEKKKSDINNRKDKTPSENWMRLHERFIDTDSRLEQALLRVRSAARFQLYIGLAFALLGFAYLVGLDYRSPPKFDGTDKVDLSEVSSFATEISKNSASGKLIIDEAVSRLPSGIMIQLFSLFFLRLYASSSKLAQYYHNELTNVQAYQAGVILMMTCQDDDFRKSTLNSVIARLMSIDRNTASSVAGTFMAALKKGSNKQSN